MSAYSDAILADNPVAYYRLDEAPGSTVAVDATGNNNTGFYFGPNLTFNKPALIADTDTAVQFAGSSTSDADQTGMQTPLSGLLSSTSQFSVECWVEVVSNASGSTNTAVIVGCGYNESGGNNPNGWNLYIDDLGKLHIVILDQADFGFHTVDTSTPLSAGAHHLVGTFDGQNISLYIDGVNVGTTTLPSASPLRIGLYNICVGSNPQHNWSNTTAKDYHQFNGVIDEVALYSFPLTATQVHNHYQIGLGNTIPLPTYQVAGDERHYFVMQVWDKTGSTLLDIPQADIEEINIQDVINGGSSTSTIVFRRGFNNIGAIAYLNRVLIWIWHGQIARPANPYWAGYMVDIDQEAFVTTGKVTVHLEGDQKQLDRGIVSENINPIIAGNPQLDAADYLRHLIGTYGPPGFATYKVPSAMFPLLPMQFSRQKLGSVIDTVVKTGRDNVGQFWTWRVSSDYQCRRTFMVQPDQNPNKIGGLKFIHLFRDTVAKYSISTKYRDIVNVVLVEGATDPQTGQTVHAVYEDGNSVASFDPWEDAISVPALVNNDACRAYGEAYLDLHANPQAQGEVELFKPDPSILSGTWIQCWETANQTNAFGITVPAVVKQVRVGSVRVNIKPTRIIQTLELTAPTPYLDEAVYKLGMNVQSAVKSLTRGLAVNTQQNFVRIGGTLSVGP